MAESDWKYLQYNVENGQKRTSDGPSGGASSLSDLDDTNISNPSDGQMLGYDGTEGKWKNVAAPAGSVTDVTLDGNTVVNGQGVAVLTTPNVNDLKDTNVSSPSDGQTLQYNATNQKWENATPASGGNVDDVKVNGTSVVTNKVANITSYKEVTQAQYEALPDTKLNDGILYAIKDGGQAVDGFPPLIYSDEEREIGVWRDGRPLYQKTFVKTLNSTSSPDGIGTAISSSEIPNCIVRHIEASWNSIPNGSEYVRYKSWEGYANFWGIGDSSVTYNARWGTYASAEAVITIRYTKTTDTPGSGTWTTQGAIAHHYSTDEHIIGTWIDGKPLYEKTVDCGAFHSTGSKPVAHNISNLNFIVSYEGCCKADNGVFLPIPLVQPGSSNINYQIRIDVNITFIGISSTSVSDIAQIYVTLRYTKTTD